ncbi:uncharacterized protein At4g15970-like isoform X2 [Asparagus officinalis]|uniref:uncharacterized protein At4g15970-like isoform X2 n=1 Tax=Asparagus officinalis TaxID=4686 RepID=UPI00098E179C|nr:uncharacterized protein At4g15970-like isoform X2 [Asparagus officinalis]
MARSPRVSTPRRTSPRYKSTSPEPGPIRRWLKAALFAAAVALPLAVLHKAAVPISPPPRSFDQLLAVGDSPEIDRARSEGEGFDPEDEQIRLESVLKEAAMEDKTVILTTLNEAWASPNSVLDIFIESFRIGEGTRNLLDHLVMVALDKKAYDRCISVHPYCFSLVTEGVDFSGEKVFMTDGYLKMMWRRIDFLRVVLEMGYNFIFTDTDIMWFRNPMPHFYPDGDFQIACDHFLGNNELDLANEPNGGFNYVKSNNRTIEFYKFWHLSRDYHPGLHDQDVLNIIKHDPFTKDLGIQMRFLRTDYFGGICEPSKDFNEVCTMHANCCIGLSSKIHDLGVMLDDWRRFMSMPPSVKKSRQHQWRVPQSCRN